MNRAFSKRAILVVVCVFGALNAGGNASLKQRVNTLEVRVNGIEMRVNTDNTVIRTKVDSVKQDIESLNASVALLEDQVCASEGSTENIGEAKKFQTLSAENVKELQLSKMVNTQGLADEKKWLREKFEGFSNLIRNSVEGFKNEMSTYKTTLNTETDDKITKQRNDFTEMRKTVANIETNFTYVIRNIEGLKSEMTTYQTEMNTETDDKFTKQRNDFTEMRKTVANIETNITYVIHNVEGLKIKMSTYQTEMNTKTDDKITKQRNDFTKMQKVVENIETNLKELNEWRNVIKEQMTSHFEMLAQKIQELEREVLCPHGWTKFQSFCYLYIAEKKNYTSARNYCSSLNANVADIENGAENEFLVQFLERNGQFDTSFSYKRLWLGLTDIDTEGTWKSDRTGLETIYRNWRSSQPDGGKRQNCIILGNEPPYDKWNDYECDRSSHEKMFSQALFLFEKFPLFVYQILAVMTCVWQAFGMQNKHRVFE